MLAKVKLNEEQWQKFHKMWKSSDYSIFDIAEAFDVEKTTVTRIAKREGMGSKNRKKTPYKYKSPEKMTPLQKELLFYLEEHSPISISLRDLEKVLGYYPTNLGTNLKRFQYMGYIAKRRGKGGCAANSANRYWMRKEGREVCERIRELNCDQ
jgi:DNA-binding MarR family transcriptional regulator